MKKRIVALENEEKAKKKIIQELEGEKHSLLRIQKEQKKAMDVMINEKELKKKRDQLKDELRNKKNELKEKQNLLRKQEKQMKEQHESLITLEEKCRKLQTLVYEKKAGLSNSSSEAKTEDDIKNLENEIKELEKTESAEKAKYKQMITTQENKIKELSLQIETLNLELKQKDQECRLNTLKINELKRQLRAGATKQPNNQSISSKQGGTAKGVSKDVEQIKKDMKAEKEHTNPEEKPIAGSSSGTPKESLSNEPESKTSSQPGNQQPGPSQEPPKEIKKELSEPKKENGEEKKAEEKKEEGKKSDEQPAPAYFW